jgi:mannosidase alpha-like ER degradation enhancer 2
MWTRFDVEPELFDYLSAEILYAGYPLRPEALESAYHLFVLTGDERYRDMGRDIFHRIVRRTRVDTGFAHLQDVRTKEKSDAMESFFLAETLKYAYLLARPDALDFDAVVFNTEAHPLWPVDR